MGSTEVDVARFGTPCATCQQVRIEQYRSGGEPHPLPVLQRKWKDVTMDVAIRLRPNGSCGYRGIVDRLRKTACFLLIRETWPVSRLVEESTRQIVRLYRISRTIVSVRDRRFTSKSWQQVQTALGTSYTA